MGCFVFLLLVGLFSVHSSLGYGVIHREDLFLEDFEGVSVLELNSTATIPGCSAPCEFIANGTTNRVRFHFEFYSGTQAAVLDSSQSNSNVHNILLFNITFPVNQTSTFSPHTRSLFFLEYWSCDYGDEYHPHDNVAIRIEGSPWMILGRLLGDLSAIYTREIYHWYLNRFDLTEHIAVALSSNSSLSSLSLQLRFMQYDGFPAGYLDGIGIDDISIYKLIVSSTSNSNPHSALALFVEDFEQIGNASNGSLPTFSSSSSHIPGLPSAEFTTSQNTSTIKLSFDSIPGAHSGSFGALMTSLGNSSQSLIFTIDLSAFQLQPSSELILDFWYIRNIKNRSINDHISYMDVISIRLLASSQWTDLITFSSANDSFINNTWLRSKFQISRELSSLSSFQVKFFQQLSTTIDLDPVEFGVDDIQVYPGTLVEDLPFFEGFEAIESEATDDFFGYEEDLYSIPGARECDFIALDGTTNAIRFNAVAFRGSFAALMYSSTESSFATNSLRFNLNLDTYSHVSEGIILDFWYIHFGEEFHIEDGLRIRGSHTDPWTQIRWTVDQGVGNGKKGVWNRAKFDLAQHLHSVGQSFSPTFQMMFTQRDNFPSNSDGIAIDDVSIYIGRLDAVLPFFEGFEGVEVGSVNGSMNGIPGLSGHFDFVATAGTTNRLDFSSEPLKPFSRTGDKQALMESAQVASFVTNHLILTLNMSTYSPVRKGVILEVWYKDWNDEVHDEDMLEIRGSTSDYWISVRRLTGGIVMSWIRIEVDLSEVLSQNGQRFSDTFQLRFGQRDNNPSLTDGISIDDIRIFEHSEGLVEYSTTTSTLSTERSTSSTSRLGTSSHDTTEPPLSDSSTSRSHTSSTQDSSTSTLISSEESGTSTGTSEQSTSTDILSEPSITTTSEPSFLTTSEHIITALPADLISTHEDQRWLLWILGIASLVVLCILIILASAFFFLKVVNRSSGDILDEGPFESVELAATAQYHTLSSDPLAPSPQENPLKESQSETQLSSSAEKWTIEPEELMLGRLLGQGCYGKVYLAQWRGQTVAVKYLHIREGGWDNETLWTFKEEGELMAQLRPHLNVVQLLGICYTQPFIVSRFYEQGSLLSFIRDERNHLSWAQALKIFRGIAAGLHHLHVEGIIHRDVAARNILLSESLDAIVSDFGFARAMSSKESSGTTNSDFGPIRWFAVECITMREYSTKSDVWAASITMWEVITRQRPYFEYDDLTTITKIMEGVQPEIPQFCLPELTQIIQQAWSPNPESRPTAEQMFQAIQSIEFSLPPQSSSQFIF